MFGQKIWITLLIGGERASRPPAQHLLPFTTTYLCGKGFSSWTVLKIKYRNALDGAEDDSRFYVSELNERSTNER